MSTEPPRTMGRTRRRPADPPGGWASDTVATFAARTLPVLKALDAVLAEDAAGLAKVLSVAEGRRPGVAAALAAALMVEADHLRQLARHAEAAAVRLHPACAAGEPAPDRIDVGNA